jgi:hypothetical protein
MNKNIKLKWVERLRNETQCTGNLRKGGSFCAIGVLCLLHSELTDNKWIRDLNLIQATHSYLGNVSSLPNEVRDWAGLTGIEKLNYQNRTMKLTEFNDIGLPFTKLAELIESQL